MPGRGKGAERFRGTRRMLLAPARGLVREPALEQAQPEDPQRRAGERHVHPVAAAVHARRHSASTIPAVASQAAR
ncbi:hypothetical protein [Amycolatopsis sp.]|uniref:hypothetical protein n=1 Tax=Amycolatopsis sp. TaxID=37632 RepID=UPI002B5B53BE|nr:hypothetical protein [Amycolatopsis sp.]HVV11368.1 hypothetical protein [Amycolatopsis sp.]